jgi:DNA-binding response OmpR family regulator
MGKRDRSIEEMEEAMSRVLVVDDEPDAVELLTEFLTAKGYEVIAASNGEEALRRLQEDRPHLILLDVRMPKMDGLEVLRRAREIDQAVGIIMVTAVHEEETGRRALQMGAFDYITKPLDLKYLEQSLWYKMMTMSL